MVSFRVDRQRGLEGLARVALRWAVAAYVLTMTGLAHSAGSSPTLAAVKARARARGIPYTRFIRETLERAIAPK